MKLKKLHMLLLLLLSTNVLFSNESSETPQIVLFFGRFHPVLLHLPIGALIVTFFLDILGRIRKDYPREIIVKALGFSCFFTFVTAILGYFLSLEGGYGKETLDIHKIAGFIMAGLSLILYISIKQKSGILRKMYMPLFILVLVVTTVTGHYGSILTHGETFLTAYSPLQSEVEEEIVTDIDSLYYYDHIIWKIVDGKCVQCHNPNKTKGELDMSTVAKLLKGGENGEVIKPGNAAESHMYSMLLLPIEEDEHMPPSGKPQLTPNEIWLIKDWINSGADFKKQLKEFPENDSLRNLAEAYLVFPKKDIKEASQKSIERIVNAGFSVQRVVFGEPFLSVTYTNTKEELNKKKLNALNALSDQIVELNLQGSQLNDQNVGTIKNLNALEVLRLDQNALSDKSLVYLKNMENLKSLNLFNTGITKDGIERLLENIDPEKVVYGDEENYTHTYFRDEETEVYKGIIQGFIEKTQLQTPNIAGNKSIFEEQIDVEITTGLKNESVYYTLDGTEPDSTSLKYSGPIRISESTELKVKSYKEGWYSSDVSSRFYSKITHEIADISVKYPPKEQYPGVHKLIDLEKGTVNFRDGKWNGYQDDFIGTVDMGAQVAIEKIAISCMEGVGSYIFFPSSIEVYAGNDKEALRKIYQEKLPPTDRNRDIKLKNYTIDVAIEKVRYVKIVLKNIGKLPEWHEGAGSDGWLFIDEIMIL